jgi:hypothetical protein
MANRSVNIDDPFLIAEDLDGPILRMAIKLVSLPRPVVNNPDYTKNKVPIHENCK